jgi:hypothetical protein
MIGLNLDQNNEPQDKIQISENYFKTLKTETFLTTLIPLIITLIIYKLLLRKVLIKRIDGMKLQLSRKLYINNIRLLLN